RADAGAVVARRRDAARAPRRRQRARRRRARGDPGGIRGRPRGSRLAARDGIASDHGRSRSAVRFPSKLFGYVLKEMAVPFLAGTLVLCFVALMPQVVRMAEKVL